MRGTMISPFSIQNGGSFSILGDIPVVAAAKASMLYWDIVEVGIVAPGMAPNIDNLARFLKEQDAGSSFSILPENRMKFPGVFIEFARAMRSKIEANKAASRVQWSYLDPSGNFEDLDKFFSMLDGVDTIGSARSTRRIIELQILNSLPVPPPNTPYMDILEFKRRRHDDLNNLWRVVDSLSVTLSGAENLDDALNLARDTVQSSLSELDRMVSETWPNRLLRHLKANIGTTIIGAGSGVFAASTLSLPMLAGAAAVPILTAVVNEVFTGPAIADRLTPYAYAYDAMSSFRR